MKLQTRLSHYGPGGRKCPCCGPAREERRRHDRRVERRVRAAGKREIAEQLAEAE